MKTLWIALSIFAGLGVVCCSGLFFYGKSIFDKTTALTADAKTFATSFTQQSLTTGTAEKAKEEVPSAAEINKLVATEFKKKGKILSLQGFTPTQRNYSRSSDGSVFIVELSSQAKFERGTSQISIDLIRSDGIWLVRSIEFSDDPPASSTSGTE